MEMNEIDVKLPEEQSSDERMPDVVSEEFADMEEQVIEVQTEDMPADAISDVLDVPLEDSEENIAEISFPEETVPMSEETAESETSCTQENSDGEQDIPEAEKIIEEEIRRESPQIISDSANAITQEQLTAILNASNEAVLTSVTALGGQLREITARVSSLRKLADMHEGIENDLNNQINSYKDNFYRRIVNPILMEIFDVQEYMNSDIPEASEETAKALREYVDMFTKILRHYGVTVETVSVGDAYDSKLHKPVKAVPTTDIALDKTIAKTRKTLIHFIDDKLVERAAVHVYQYTETADSPAENA